MNYLRVFHRMEIGGGAQQVNFLKAKRKTKSDVLIEGEEMR